jgi:hypothetical protein
MCVGLGPGHIDGCPAGRGLCSAFSQDSRPFGFPFGYAQGSAKKGRLWANICRTSGTGLWLLWCVLGGVGVRNAVGSLTYILFWTVMVLTVCLPPFAKPAKDRAPQSDSASEIKTCGRLCHPPKSAATLADGGSPT